MASAACLLSCVGLQTHEGVVAERDDLASQVALLEASNASFTAEQVDLLESLEDEREAHARLEQEAGQLRSLRESLSQNLSAREAELARQNAEVSRLRGTYEALVDDLESELAAGQIEIQQLREGLRVNVSDEILFASGSARIGAQGRDVLRRVAGQLVDLPHAIEVEGHTDNVKIRGSLAKRYPSNWELAGARAASVVRLFEGEGVDASRMIVVSYGSTQPVASNDDAESRSRNRRIEIRLKPVSDPPRSEPPERSPPEPAS
jgi:chemotaxis protein MotB